MPPAQKSIVWEFFHKLPGNTLAECMLCKQKLKYFASTGNLRQHLSRKHPIQFQEHLNKNASNITTDSTSALPPPASSQSGTLETDVEPNVKPTRKRQLKLFGGRDSTEFTDAQKKKCDLSLLKLIVKDFQPLSIVENIGFLEYTKTLNPLYEVPSRHILTKSILSEQYTQEVARLKSLLLEVKYVSLTTDIWQSDSNISYLSVTCHFIHNSVLHSRVLSTKQMTSEHHTGRNIASDLQSIIDEWGLNENHKIVTIVSDNGANVKNAIVEHLNKHHHPCVAHTLNLIVKESLNGNHDLKCLIAKCKSLVTYFKHSALATGKLTKCQQDMGLPCLKIKQAVDTRWNSTLLMLERLLEMKNPLSVSVSSLPAAPEFIDALQWNIISDCVPILKPLELMTTELSGEKYVTMATVIPLVRGLQYNLKNMRPSTEIGLWLQSKLIDTISRRLGILESNKIVAKSTFLDPRFKKTAFGLEENAKNTQMWIIDEIAATVSCSNKNVNTEVSNPESEGNSSTSKSSSLWSHFEQKLKEVETKLTPITSSTLSVRQYLELPHCDRKSNPLEFWEKQKLMLPEMYVLHKKYAGIPATSVPSERLFSKAGQLTNLRRNRLSPKHANMILFLNGS